MHPVSFGYSVLRTAPVGTIGWDGAARVALRRATLRPGGVGQPDNATQHTGSRLPTIAEETIEVDESDTETDKSSAATPVYVVDSPEPAPNQGTFDQTDNKGPTLPLERRRQQPLTSISSLRRRTHRLKN